MCRGPRGVRFLVPQISGFQVQHTAAQILRRNLTKRQTSTRAQDVGGTLSSPFNFNPLSHSRGTHNHLNPRRCLPEVRGCRACWSSGRSAASHVCECVRVCVHLCASPPLSCVCATSTPLPGLPPRATCAPPQFSGSPRLGSRPGSPSLNLSPPPTDAARVQPTRQPPSLDSQTKTSAHNAPGGPGKTRRGGNPGTQARAPRGRREGGRRRKKGPTVGAQRSITSSREPPRAQRRIF